MLSRVRELVQPAMERHGPIEAWIIDDTGFAKRVGTGLAWRIVLRRLGQAGDCQVAVTLSIANRHASLPVGYRLYLPKEWAEDRARRKKARIPKEVAFKTKRRCARSGPRRLGGRIARGVGLMDGAYGCDTELRTGIGALGMKYVASVPAAITVWPPGCEPLPPKPYVGHGRRPTRLRRDSTQSRSRSRRSRSACRKKLGARSAGAKAAMTGSARALPGCGYGPPLMTTATGAASARVVADRIARR